MIEARTEIHRGTELVAALGAELLSRYGDDSTPLAVNDVIRAQAAKRVALQFVASRAASWDHRELAGGY